MVEAEAGIGEEHAALRLVCFHLGEQEHALPIASVRETIRVRPMTSVFLTPPWLAGIFSLRGEIVPAVDIAPWLGMPATAVREETRLIVLRHPTRTLAILADDLAELRTLAPADIAPPPPTLSPEQGILLTGVAATPTGTVRILDHGAILGADRLRALSGDATSPP